MGWRSGRGSAAGLLAFALGVLMLIAGGLQRYEGELSWGGRYERGKRLRREQAPVLFDRVTAGLIAGGLVLTLGGLAVAWVTDPPARDD